MGNVGYLYSVFRWIAVISILKTYMTNSQAGKDRQDFWLRMREERKRDGSQFLVNTQGKQEKSDTQGRGKVTK